MNFTWNSDAIPILQLGADFYDEAIPAVFPSEILRYWNSKTVLEKNNLDKKSLWNFKVLNNNLPAPLALRYHGHQFQQYNPQIGDGRGFLFAQLKHKDNQTDQWYDLGTKGSGQTVYSRSGDGRLTLKGAVREALATEMLESLGINTSKTLCIYETGENLIRSDEPSPTRSAVLTRLSLGHIRIGTFQRLAFYKQTENIKKLVSYCLHFYYQKENENLKHKDDLQIAEIFLQLVRQRQASLAAEIMMAGFVHGVLNTDNINISGELFDYGPYRFLPTYDPNFIAAYFDQQGLYCFGRQPHSILWNLHQLGLSLKEAFPGLDYETVLNSFSDDFNLAIQKKFLHRLNLKTDDTQLVAETVSTYFKFMAASKIPFEQMFFDFFGFNLKRINTSVHADKYSGSDFENLKSHFSKMNCANEALNTHPYFLNSKPETLLIEEIESIWNAIDKNDDWSLFEKKLQSLRSMRGIY